MRSSAAIRTFTTPGNAATRSTRLWAGPRSVRPGRATAAASRIAASSSWTSPASGTRTVTAGTRMARPRAAAGRPSGSRRPLDHRAPPTVRSRVRTAPTRPPGHGGPGRSVRPAPSIRRESSPQAARPSAASIARRVNTTAIARGTRVRVDVAVDVLAVRGVRGGGGDGGRRSVAPGQRRLHGLGAVGDLADPGERDARVTRPAPAAQRDDRRDAHDRVARRGLRQLPVRGPRRRPAAAGMRTSTTSSSGSMAVSNGALEEPVQRDRRARPATERSTSSASSARTTAGMSDAGSAWASEPPSVPRLRTWTSPMSWMASSAAAPARRPAPTRAPPR